MHWLVRALLPVAASLSLGCAGGATARVRPAEVVVYRAPPPPGAPVDVRPPAPGPRHVWIPGYYDWDGRWIWIEGRWERERAGRVWTPPTAERLPDGRIAYHRGYWRPSHAAPPRAYARPGRIVVAHPPPPMRGVPPGLAPSARHAERAMPRRDEPQVDPGSDEAVDARSRARRRRRPAEEPSARVEPR